MIRAALLAVLSISYETVLIVLPGLIFGVLFFVFLAGNWLLGAGSLMIFTIYIVVVSALKDKLLSALSKDEDPNV